MSIEQLREEIHKIDRSIARAEKSKTECKSDLLYWAYVGEIEELAKKKSGLNKDIYYLEITEALESLLDDSDVGHRVLKERLLPIINEHKNSTKAVIK